MENCLGILKSITFKVVTIVCKHFWQLLKKLGYFILCHLVTLILRQTVYIVSNLRSGGFSFRWTLPASIFSGSFSHNYWWLTYQSRSQIYIIPFIYQCIAQIYHSLLFLCPSMPYLYQSFAIKLNPLPNHTSPYLDQYNFVFLHLPTKPCLFQSVV